MGEVDDEAGADVDGAERGGVEQVAAWIRAARPTPGITVLTGAGISTESGIPDFRGPAGLWTRDPDAERLATIGVYLRDDDVRRRSWRWRLDHPAWSAEPNAGHRALVDLERRGYVRAIVTQNIDGLHQRAGSDPERVIEVHGSMREVLCVDCGDRAPTEHALERVRAGEDDPRCRRCGGILKTATVFFGEPLDEGDVARAEAAAAACAVFVAVGTSLQVFPVALLPGVALEAGARLVIVNEEPTPYDAAADAVLRGSAGAILTDLAARV